MTFYVWGKAQASHSHWILWGRSDINLLGGVPSGGWGREWLEPKH